MAHILIIDDEPSILSLFGQFLESEGFSVALASDGREGMYLLKQRRPDLIITDIMMPEMDGLEVLREIGRQYADIPVIAISGGMKGGLMSFLPHAQRFGACRIFEKPVKLSTLLAAVKELLAGTPADQ